ncbi:MAG: type I DNA topoisomerase [Flavobacteriales bacterium]|nr:type I DNA topoisomerase [Flavobacteriales bacterium]
MNLVIVESPAKAKTIEGFLGEGFVVKSSYGHIRDLEKSDLSIDKTNGFAPTYTNLADKKDLIKELTELSKKADIIWLATDEDREGEAISWHLFEALNLTEEKTKRIVFNEITKTAIQKAIDNPRKINKNLVDAQQARRILDRLVGFELSPVLWKKVKPALSAGRVQSVAVRLIAERESEIESFKPESFYRVRAKLKTDQGKIIDAELSSRLHDAKVAEELLEACKNSDFTIRDLVTKPLKRNPSAPFTTSTLQQEASRRLGYSVGQTMRIAQRLYEAGKITYMRTDSVNLSEEAISKAAEVISNKYGEQYSNPKNYTTKSKGAQEAHEAIRPTYLDQDSVTGEGQEEKLYQLIWKRTMASQMSPAQLEKTTAYINISGWTDHEFQASGEIMKFDGFMKLYVSQDQDEEDQDEKDDKILPPLEKNQALTYNQIEAVERFTKHPPRYSEASLVKKLEENGIGRPSTYAPTISTIQKRGYVVKESKDGHPRNYQKFLLKSDEIAQTVETENTGVEKNKLFPTDIGVVVNEYLVKNFSKILDYSFTANVEKEFDMIAEGQKIWNEMIGGFYDPFHKTVEDALEHSEKAKGERLLGVDPETGKNVYVKIGRYGPMVQIGETEDEEKPKFASLKGDLSLRDVTLEQALKMFELPRTIGDYNDKEVVIGIGRYGPYVRWDGKFVSLGDLDPYSVELPKAIELIKEKEKAEKERIIKEIEGSDFVILKGRWGPYLSDGKKNYRIPKGTEAESLTLEMCQEITENSGKKTKKAKKA